MRNHHRSSAEIDDNLVDDLLAGCPDGDRTGRSELAALVVELRTLENRPAPPVVRPELTAVFATGLVPGRETAAAEPLNEPPSRRQRMLTALGTFLATLTGKVVLGTAAAAASVGAAHAVGVVDVPGLPDKAAVVELPAEENAGDNGPDGRSDVESGQPSSPGVDGGAVSDRATSGEPREDGKAFGTSVAEEAVEGTPAEGRPGSGGAGTDPRPEAPADGTDVADEHRPSTPTGGSSVANDPAPDDPPAGPEIADEQTPGDPPADRP